MITLCRLSKSQSGAKASALTRLRTRYWSRMMYSPDSTVSCLGAGLFELGQHRVDKEKSVEHQNFQGRCGGLATAAAPIWQRLENSLIRQRFGDRCQGRLFR
jgi:hypothetical protein